MASIGNPKFNPQVKTKVALQDIKINHLSCPKSQVATKNNVTTSLQPSRLSNIQKSIEHYIKNNDESPSDKFLQDFKKGIKFQENNPNPDSSYRGIGVKVNIEGVGLRYLKFFHPASRDLHHIRKIIRVGSMMYLLLVKLIFINWV